MGVKTIKIWISFYIPSLGIINVQISATLIMVLSRISMKIKIWDGEPIGQEVGGGSRGGVKYGGTKSSKRH